VNSAVNAGLPISADYAAFSEAVFHVCVATMFFLAGLFVERSFEKQGFRRFLAERLTRLAYPYFVWSTLQITAEIVFSGQSSHDTGFDALLAIPYWPHAHFWFFYSLLWAFVAFALLRQTTSWWRPALVISAVVLLFVPIPTIAMGLYQFSIEFGFFVAGILLAPWLVGRRQLPPLTPTSSLIATLVYAGAVTVLFTQIIPPSVLLTYEYRFFYPVMGTLVSVVIIGWSQVLAERRLFGWLAVVGTYSLEIYVAHMLSSVASRIVVTKILGIGDPLVVVVVGIVAGTLGPIVLLKLMARLRLPSLFDLPRALPAPTKRMA
jgi:peptidoglycan/LPS O-acetylase OafA/YrhL